MTAPGELSPQDVAKVAAEAKVDPRTVLRALEGRTKSFVVRCAIVRALRDAGFRREARKLEDEGKAEK